MNMNWPQAQEHAKALMASVPETIENPYVSTLLILSVSIYVFQQYVNYRQHCKLSEKKLPEKLGKIIKPEEFEKARLYSLDKSNFAFISDFFGLLNLAYFLFMWYPQIWNLSGDLVTKYIGNKTEINQSLIFLGFMVLIGKLQSIPFELYSIFVIEKKHGFNKQTIGLYVSDMLKGFMLQALLGGPFVAAFIWVVRRFGENFYLAVWLLVFGFQMFVMLIFPTFIQPLFNKFESLPEGTLRTKIEDLARKLSFPLSKIFVMDGSKRSSHSNAYFFGFFSKRIVLFDTLIQQNSEEEICAVLGHELGHWKCWHQLQMLVATQIHIFALFYAFSHFINRSEIYEAFGFRNEMPVIIGFMLFGGFSAPSEIVLSFLMNLLSRKNEFEADRFAVKLGYGDLLQSALIKLQIENKGNMNPDWMYSAMNYSHPPLLERLNAIKSAMDKQK